MLNQLVLLNNRRGLLTMALRDLQKLGILRLFWKGCLETKRPHYSSATNTCFLLVNFTAITLATRSTRGCSHQNLYRTSVQSVSALHWCTQFQCSATQASISFQYGSSKNIVYCIQSVKLNSYSNASVFLSLCNELWYFHLTQTPLLAIKRSRRAFSDDQ